MLIAPEYNLEVQAHILVVLSALHNFIHIHDPDEGSILDSNNHHLFQDTDENDSTPGRSDMQVEGEVDYDEQWEWIAEAM